MKIRVVCKQSNTKLAWNFKPKFKPNFKPKFKPNFKNISFVHILLGLLTLARFFIAYNIPVIVYSNYSHDDVRYMEMAQSLMGGEWLGEYGSRTLIKGVTYAWFLCVSGLTRIPYTILLTALLVFAAFIFLKAVQPLVSNFYLRSLLYVVLIYSPQTLNAIISQRLYRNALTVPLTLLIFAGVLGVYFNIETKKRWAYAVLTGLSLALFWNLREDSIWILPFVLVASAITVVFAVCNLIKREKGQKKGKNFRVGLAKIGGVLILPLVIFAAINSSVCFMNYKYYGVYALNDRTYTAFDEVLSLCIKIDYEEDESVNPKACYTSYEKFEYIIDHSQTLSEHKSAFLSAYQNWSKGGNLNGDFLQWAFRLGLVKAGMYRDGAATQAFLEQVAEELQQALDSGQLQYKEGIFLSSSTRMITASELPEIIEQTIKETFPYVISYEGVVSAVGYSVGDDETLRKGEFVANSYILYPEEAEDSVYIKTATLFVDIANKIIECYAVLSVPMTYIALISFAIMTLLQLCNLRWKNRKLFDYWLIEGALICSAFAGLAMFTIFRGTWMPLAQVSNYSSGAYILWLAFQLIAIVFVVEGCVNLLRRLKLAL